MPRIPDDEIDRIKRTTDLATLVRSRGIELKKHGSSNLVGRCPFHDDGNTPNLIVTPSKGLYHCMACGAAGNPIQFVQKFDGVSFRHAFELLADGGKAAFEDVPPNGTPRRQATIPKLACPLNPETDDNTLLGQVATYYHERLKQTPGALAYLKERGLDDDELIRHFKIGFGDRTLGLRLPHKNRKAGALLRERLETLGVYRESGHEHFTGSIVIPVSTPKGWVSEMYGRKITKNLRKGTPLHLYLPGPHRGIFNETTLEQREIILCESLIDALTFFRYGMEAVTTIYGTEGFTDELFEAIQGGRNRKRSLRLRC